MTGIKSFDEKNETGEVVTWTNRDEKERVVKQTDKGKPHTHTM
jgi:hypothetical protein